MKIGHCKDCKHWESYGYGPQFRERLHTCELPEFADEEERPADNGFLLYAAASDDHGLRAELRTGPLFGCVKFE